ncbi:MAG: efflux RND transporter periplasmic adaptor subunit [Gemmatimonadetes bacterium]|nr:efflux RND transporter periplasmic adaptor subunit [Gemmatimonadota bacterium]
MAALIVLLLGSGIYVRIKGAGESGAEGSEGSASASGDRPEVSATSAFATDIAIPVEGARVVRDTLVISVAASGQAAASRQTVVLAQVAGRVAQLPVRENDAVAAGARLLVLESAEYELSVAEAQAGLREARARYGELVLFDEMLPDSAVRAERESVARAKSGLDAAEVRLRRAELDLARTRVAAPFAGRVASIRIVPGQWVRPGDELLTVVDLDPIKVEVQVLEGEVGYLAPGRRARVSFAAFADQTFAGRIETINPLVERETRTARVTVVVPNPGGRILPGMYARVSLDARRFPGRILVPRAAILERDRRTMLFVYEGDARGGLAKWRYVTTGLENESLVEIVPDPETEKVEPGEIVLTDGHYTLVHDARVRLVADVAAAGGRPN